VHLVGFYYKNNLGANGVENFGLLV